jgi:tRNA-specific 2-thiouridylase
MYVIRLDVARNALVVGPSRELGRRSLVAESVSYVSGQSPPQPVQVKAKIRYQAALASGLWTPLEGGRARVEFQNALRDITPGQAIVAYEGNVVLGGGIISEAAS